MMQQGLAPMLADEWEPPRRGAAYAVRAWQTLDAMRAGGLPWAQQQKLKQRALGDQIRHTGFSFMRPLEGHVSCINALSFSRDGRWLASGGDDMRVQIRDMYEDINSERSDIFVTLPGHRANIFTISWSCDGQHLFSGGNDGRVYQYDVSTLSNAAKRARLTLEPGQSHRAFWHRLPFLPPTSTLSESTTMTGLEFLLGTSPSIREVSAHPGNPNLLLACTQNGVLTLNDVRTPAPSVVARARLSARRGLFALGGRSFAGVQWRPLASDGNTFAACVSTVSTKLDVANIKLNAGTRLYDTRMCFRGSSAAGGADLSDPDQAAFLTDNNAVLVYDSVLERFERRADDEVRAYFALADGLNVRFDSTGEYLVTDVTGFKPIIYQINQSAPIAVCDAKGYSTRCTTKHGSFGRFGTAWEDLAPTPLPERPNNGKTTARTLSDLLDDGGEAARETAAHSRIEREGLYYVTGSDDFRAYGWSVPSAQTLLSKRQEVDELSILRGEQAIDGLYFVSSGGAPVWVPRLAKPAFTLEGAQSITNTALAHPHLPLIATSGIERLVRIYSPLPFSCHDEIPADGGLSVPLLNPGLTRQRGKKPRQPEGANDERDSIVIAQTLLAHSSSDTDDGGSERRQKDRLLRCRQLCREGDVDDAMTVLQFDEYLLEEERERRAKRSMQGRRTHGSPDHPPVTATSASAAVEEEGKELFNSKPDLVYRLRRLFDDTHRRSEGVVGGTGLLRSLSTTSGGGEHHAGFTSTASSPARRQAALMQRSGSADTGSALEATALLTPASASPRLMSMSPSATAVPRATRPWRRTEGRRVQQAQERQEEAESGAVAGMQGAAPPESRRMELDAISDPGPSFATGGSSENADSSLQDELDDSEASDNFSEFDGDDDTEDDDDGDEVRGGDSGAAVSAGGNVEQTQDWLLRASRRLGLQQLSSRIPPKLAGGVWDVRQYSPSVPSTTIAASGGTGRDAAVTALVAAGTRERALSLFGVEAGGEPERDVDADGNRDRTTQTDESQGAAPGAAESPSGDADAAAEEDDDEALDNVTEYQRWVQVELGRTERDMDVDADTTDEEDEDDEEMLGEDADEERGGGSAPFGESDDEEDDSDDGGAVAYRRLGRERP